MKTCAACTKCIIWSTYLLVLLQEIDEVVRFDENEAKTLVELGHETLRRLMALPLLPPDQMPHGFSFIKKKCDGRLGELFSPLFTYFGDYWMDVVQPSRFTVHNMLRRTNNYNEVYNAQLLRELHKSPSMRTCLSKFTLVVTMMGQENRLHFCR